ncbi:MAG: hypothetical protein IKF64_09005 [Eubacterium sp.]|nr:hypothetical protein [Eubacterium sp.]
MAKKKSGFSIRKLVFNDKYLIILSLLLAVIVWIVTSLNIGTEENKIVKVSVPIKLGDEVSEQLGMQYYTLQDTIDISVTVSGAKYAIGQVTENDLSIKFDTSNVNRTGEQSIPILVTKKNNQLDFTVTSTYPAAVDAFFDVNESKNFDLYLKYDENAVSKGYTFGEPILSEDKINISGPKTYVDKIERAVVDVDFGSETKLTQPYKAECPITVEGLGVETSYLRFADKDDTSETISNVAVTLPVLKVTELPVSVNVDDMPEGFDESNLTLEYSEKTITAGVLESAGITQAVIGTIDFSEIKEGKNKFAFDVTNLEGITVLDEDLDEITVTARLSNDYTEKTVTINPADISITGVSADSEATLKHLSSRRVTVLVPDKNKKDDVTVSVVCDLGGANESGTYPLTITVNGIESAWVYGEYTADITVVTD